MKSVATGHVGGSINIDSGMGEALRSDSFDEEDHIKPVVETVRTHSQRVSKTGAVQTESNAAKSMNVEVQAEEMKTKDVESQVDPY